MDIPDISKELPQRYAPMRRSLSSVKYAIIHHTGAYARDGDDIIIRAKDIARYHTKTKRWNRIGYHYLIGRDGKVIQVSDLRDITYHAGNWGYNKKGLGVMLDGDIETQGLTTAQVTSFWELMNYLTTKRPDMPHLLKDTIKTHNEVRNSPTICPGKQLKELIKTYKVKF